MHQLYKIKIMHCIAGCQNTPCKESRYCSVHDKHATSFKDDMQVQQNQTEEEDSTLIIKILNKKSTRQEDFYEVSLNKCSLQ